MLAIFFDQEAEEVVLFASADGNTLIHAVCSCRPEHGMCGCALVGNVVDIDMGNDYTYEENPDDCMICLDLEKGPCLYCGGLS